jgi:hypothetical protein
LSGLPPREIGRYALEWRLWVGRVPAGSSANLPMSNRAVLTSKSDGELFTGNENRNIARFSIPQPRNLSPNSRGSGLRRSSTLPVFNSGFSQDPLMPEMTVPKLGWPLPWTLSSVTMLDASSGSPPTPSLVATPEFMSCTEGIVPSAASRASVPMLGLFSCHPSVWSLVRSLAFIVLLEASKLSA